MSRNLQRITLQHIKAVERGGEEEEEEDEERETPGASLLPFFPFFHASRAQLERGGRGDDLKAALPCDVRGQVAAHRGGGGGGGRHWCMMGKSVTVNQREDCGNEAALWEKCIFLGRWTER